MGKIVPSIRPTDIDTDFTKLTPHIQNIIVKWEEPKSLDKVYEWGTYGHSKASIAHKMNIEVASLRQVLKISQKIYDNYYKGFNTALDNLENIYYKLATGYTAIDTTTENRYNKDKELIGTLEKRLEKEVAPNTTILLRLLTTYRSDDYALRDKRDSALLDARLAETLVKTKKTKKELELLGTVDTNALSINLTS